MNDVLVVKEGNPELGMILLHGRGADAEDIMGIVKELDDNDFLYAAPRAPLNTWYPFSFMAPVESNEPYLSDSLETIGSLIKELSSGGIPEERLIIVGFSQGACLGLEYILRNPMKYGGVCAFSGATISVMASDKNKLKGTPIFIGSSERDPHIPVERVELAAELLKNMGGEVIKKIYPGSFHSINNDELMKLREITAKMKVK